MEFRPFQREGLTSRVAPFVLVALAANLEVALRSGVHWQLIVATAALIALVAAIFVVTWASLPRGADAIVPFLYFLVIAILRDGDGGRAAIVGALVYLPVVWFALYGTGRELGLAIAAAAGVYIGPAVVIGAPRYPSTEYLRAVNLIVILSLVGLTVHRLVKESKVLATELEEQALRDPLTGLGNRRAWDSALAAAVVKSERVGWPLSIAIIDLDGLKVINDAGGHAAGDHALRTVAAAWEGSLPPGAMLARLGGDEFALLLPGADARSALEIVEVLRGAGGYGCSAGVAQRRDGHEPNDLMGVADAALYEAKHGGRDRVHAAVA